MEQTLDELNIAISKLGSGIGIDGIHPGINKLLPPNMREIITSLLIKVFNLIYPDI